MYKGRNTAYAAKSLLSARFLLAAFVLIIAAVGLRGGIQALSAYYTKQPIDIRCPLREFDISRLPSFKDGWVGTNIPPEEIETDEYAIIKLKRQGVAESPKEAALFITYYSDPRSKVPHTPDVCYRQGGAVVKKMETITIDIPELTQCPQAKVQLLLFEMPRSNQVVIFCFYVDGVFKHSREQVRWTMGKPGNRHTYFSKIETVSNYPLNEKPDKAIDVCRKLFCEAVAILVSEYFPTKEQLK